MKIIFSRKGFDSGFGNLPSPILPDGKMLSIPIPEVAKDVDYIKNRKISKYSDLIYENESYLKVIKDLKNERLPKMCHSIECHVDPDIENRYTKSPKGWKPAFGQKGNAAKHLDDNEVTIGDVFLFFGWFRMAEKVGDKYQYIKSAPDIHAIYGYMEIGNIIYDDKIIKREYPYHPHAQYAIDPNTKQNNRLYIPCENFSYLEGTPGYKMLNYSEKRRLTAPNETKRGMWSLPEFFRNIEMTYHPNLKNVDLTKFRSASRGQEFICKCDGNKEIENWLKDILTD